MTPEGVEFVKKKLRKGATSLDALRDTWGTIAIAYQKHPDVLDLKNELKAELGGEVSA